MSEEFEHRVPECRATAKLSAEERVRLALTERWISYPRAALALSRLGHLLAYLPRDRMPCLLLYGATGMGKTQILKKFIRSPPAPAGPASMPIVLMQMPPEPDEKSFYLELLQAMKETSRFGQTTGQLRHVMRDLLKLLEAPDANGGRSGSSLLKSRQVTHYEINTLFLCLDRSH
jgi:Bacterial TniB protein